jgi:hypothetical protein
MFDETVCDYFPFGKNLLLWVTVVSETNKTYYIISDKFRNEYTLWKGNRQTRYKNSNPVELYKYIKEVNYNV